MVRLKRKYEAEGLPIYMDKGDAFWIRPMKTTLKVEQWYSLLQDHLSVAVVNRVVIVRTFTWPMLLWQMPC